MYSEEENKKESEKVFSELKSEFLNLEIARDEFQKISSVLTETIKPIADTYSKILSQIVIPKIDLSPMLSVIDKIRESYSYTFKSLINTISLIDFEKYKKDLEELDKRKIAQFLHFDIYPPLLFIDEMGSYEIENQKEANIVLMEYLSLWEEEYGRTVYDFVPKSLKTYREIEQLQNLEQLKMYKTMVMFCCERIENVLAELQLQEQEKKQSEIKISHDSVRNFMDSLNHNDYLKEVISQIAYISEYHDEGYRQINLFIKFKYLEEDYDEETLPLNRNLFMHGLVDEKIVNYLMVQKAILAYSFFVQLYVLKTRNSKDARIKGLRRKGISRMSKSQRRFYANESRN
ncbi:hypothetical protein [Streptococcus mitis]|uniref:hypothetical protein n=1 Tax=Streptococcus mitis TaxID=28037 RepID=UPI0021B62A8C|nr:hypothetical protein [Streptococcus mitis]